MEKLTRRVKLLLLLLLLFFLLAAFGVEMLDLRRFAKISGIIVISYVLSMLLMSHISFASQVRVCKKLKKKQEIIDLEANPKEKKIYCSVKPKTGIIGDYVEIKNKYNYTVAIGRVVKHTRSSTIIVLKKYDPNVGSMSGYPVMIRREGDQNYWSASTAPF